MCIEAIKVQFLDPITPLKGGEMIMVAATALLRQMATVYPELAEYQETQVLAQAVALDLVVRFKARASTEEWASYATDALERLQVTLGMLKGMQE